MDIEEGPGWAWRLGPAWQTGDDRSAVSPPTGWLSVRDVVAWIVWRETPQTLWWPHSFYPGAEEWWHPVAAIQALEAIANRNHERYRTSADLPDWLRCSFLDGNLIGPLVPGGPLEEQPEKWARAAKKLIDDFNADWGPDYGFAAAYAKRVEQCILPPPDPEFADWMFSLGSSAEYDRRVQNYGDLWEGSETLRRALAADHLPAFGLPSPLPEKGSGRCRIPPNTFSAPVCLVPSVVLPCTVSEAWDVDQRPLPIWTNLLFEAEDVLRVWADPPRATTAAEEDMLAAAVAWMIENASSRKYEEAVGDCVAATGCSFRQAKTARAKAKEQAPGQLRSRGRPRKSDG